MRVRIAVGIDRYLRWHDGFAAALANARSQEPWIDFELIDFDHHDWIERVERYDCVLWKSYVLGPQAAALYKEKMYFLETHLRKLVFPNFKTLWHYESKAAQSYIFKKEGIPTPRTIVSFDYHDAKQALNEMPPPYVFKHPAGTDGLSVWKVEDVDEGERELERTFAYQLWNEGVTGSTRRARMIRSLRYVAKRWMRVRVKDRMLGSELFRPAYWQEFVPGNEADLRITVIGGKYASAFWRHNRPNDFRAGGSELLDYGRHVPMEALELCFEFVRRMDYDTMAFDLLRDGNKWLIAEMSYA